MSRIVVRSLVVLVALVLFAAVSSVYADQIGGGFQHDNFMKAEPPVLSHSSAHLFQVPELTSNTIYGENNDSWRITGIRDGHWLRFSLRDGWKDITTIGTGGGGAVTTPPVSTPEPGTLLLLGAGLFILRRRVQKA
jgi:PEP-CTERM motif